MNKITIKRVLETDPAFPPVHDLLKANLVVVMYETRIVLGTLSDANGNKHDFLVTVSRVYDLSSDWEGWVVTSANEAKTVVEGNFYIEISPLSAWHDTVVRELLEDAIHDDPALAITEGQVLYFDKEGQNA